MGFMRPQVYETDYLEIDGPCGTEIIPCDVADWRPEDATVGGFYQITGDMPVPEDLKDYCENSRAHSIERKHGWVGRMSAPGYLDSTTWSACETEEKMRAELASMYEDDEDTSAEEPITSDEHASIERAERNRERT